MAFRTGGPSNPKKARQIERLAPKFIELRDALDTRRGALQGDAAGVALEQVLVFETNGPVKDSTRRSRRQAGFGYFDQFYLSTGNASF